MDDKEIVALYWNRSESAISETAKKYGRYCHYIAYKILNDESDAEEVVNDTYLKTWNTIPENRPDPLKPYVGLISRQSALDRYEKQHAQKRGGQIPILLDELSDCIPDADSSSDIGESVALCNALNNFIRSLPEQHQIIFIRRYWYASSISEIAADLGLKESNVGVILLRARKKLKKLLEEEGFGI